LDAGQQLAVWSLELSPDSYRDWSLEQFGGCALLTQNGKEK